MASEVHPDTDTVTISSKVQESPSEAVVRTVANAEGIDIVDLPPVYEVIDPDALDALFDGETSATVVFEYYGYVVTVNENGAVTLEE